MCPECRHMCAVTWQYLYYYMENIVMPAHLFIGPSVGCIYWNWLVHTQTITIKFALIFQFLLFLHCLLRFFMIVPQNENNDLNMAWTFVIVCRWQRRQRNTQKQDEACATESFNKWMNIFKYAIGVIQIISNGTSLGTSILDNIELDHIYSCVLC